MLLARIAGRIHSRRACWSLGLLVGSFLNVVIYRLPVMLERAVAGAVRRAAPTPPGRRHRGRRPRHRRHSISWCRAQPVRACRAPITRPAEHSAAELPGAARPLRQLPAPISLRYPLVEAAERACSRRWWPGSSASASRRWLRCVLTWFLIALTFIDVDTPAAARLADAATAVAGPAGEPGRLDSSGQACRCDPRAAPSAAQAGYLTLWSVYHLFELLTGKEGMGYGDFKLLAALGAWLGWQMLLPIVLLRGGRGRGRRHRHPDRCSARGAAARCLRAVSGRRRLDHDDVGSANWSRAIWGCSARARLKRPAADRTDRRYRQRQDHLSAACSRRWACRSSMPIRLPVTWSRPARALLAQRVRALRRPVAARPTGSLDRRGAARAGICRPRASARPGGSAASGDHARAASGCAARAGGVYQIHVIPLLVETPPRSRSFDRVLVVDCPESCSCARLQARDGVHAAAGTGRAGRQAPRGAPGGRRRRHRQRRRAGGSGAEGARPASAISAARGARSALPRRADGRD